MSGGEAADKLREEIKRLQQQIEEIKAKARKDRKEGKTGEPETPEPKKKDEDAPMTNEESKNE